MPRIGEHLVLFDSEPLAPTNARDFTREAWGNDPRIDDIILMVSELVTNAVRHGSGSRVILTLAEKEGRLRVEVRQAGRLSELIVPNHQPNGFGLKIIESLSESWGTGHPKWAGVWFEMASEVA